MHKLIELFYKNGTAFSKLVGTQIFAVIIFCLFLAGCSSTGSGNSSQETINPKARIGETTIYANATDSSSSYETKAAQSAGNDKVNWSLLAAKAYLKEGNFGATTNKLLEIQGLLTNDPQLAEWHLIKAQSELAQGNMDGALNSLNFPSTWQLDNNQYRRYYALRSDIYRRKGDTFASVTALVSADNYFTDPATRHNNETQLWQILMQMPTDQMTSISVDRSNGVLFGWLEVAYIQKTKIDPNERNVALNQWMKQHPKHPAVAYFSGSVVPEANASVSLGQYKNVAVLLPLSGRFESIGTIIRDGITAAYNNDPNKGSHQLNVYDDSGDMATLYAQLQTQGVDLVIGPLQKDKVIAFKALNQGKITVLLLNKGDGLPATNTCLFSLSPEDEAAQVADKMAADQQTAPMVLAPRNAYGQTMAGVFSARWSQISGGIPAIVNYYGDQTTISNDIKVAMATQASAIYLIGGTNDIVMNVPYMQSNAPRATLPPIYTSSRANSGSNMSFSEIKGINYSDIPVLVNQDSNFLSQYTAQYKNSDYAKIRFYAQGMDAYRLIDGLSQLQSSPGYVIQGNSGNLSLDNGTCSVKRQFSWGVFGEAPTTQPVDNSSGDVSNTPSGETTTTSSSSSSDAITF